MDCDAPSPGRNSRDVPQPDRGPRRAGVRSDRGPRDASPVPLGERRLPERPVAARRLLAGRPGRDARRLRLRRDRPRPERHQRRHRRLPRPPRRPLHDDRRRAVAAERRRAARLGRHRRPAGQRPLLPARRRRQRAQPQPALHRLRLRREQPRPRRHQRQARRVPARPEDRQDDARLGRAEGRAVERRDLRRPGRRRLLARRLHQRRDQPAPDQGRRRQEQVPEAARDAGAAPRHEAGLRPLPEQGQGQREPRRHDVPRLGLEPQGARLRQLLRRVVRPARRGLPQLLRHDLRRLAQLHLRRPEPDRRATRTASPTSTSATSSSRS